MEKHTSVGPNVRFVRGIQMLLDGYLRSLNPSYLNWFIIIKITTKVPLRGFEHLN
jgi:hypothetical protein